MDKSEFESWAMGLTGTEDPTLTWQLIPESPTSTAEPQILHGKLSHLCERLEISQHEGCGVFACINATNGAGRKGADIQAIRAVWCDIDSGIYKKAPVEPTMVVRTKAGWHLYWVLEKQIEDGAWCEATNRSIALLLGGDKNSTDRARVLRVPGFLHQKGEPTMVRVASKSGVLYRQDVLTEHFPHQTLYTPRQSTATNTVALEDSLYGLSAAKGEYDVLSETGEGGRNNALNRSAFKLGTLVAGGELTEETAVDFLMKGAEENGYLNEEGEEHVQYVIESSFKAAEKSPRNTSKSSNKRHTGTNTPQPEICGTLVSERWPKVEAELRQRLAKGYRPIVSPLPGLNAMLGGGAAMGGVTLVCAPPGAGKSSLCLHWCISAAQQGFTTIYVSLELNLVDLITRMCSIGGNIGWLDARMGEGIDRMHKVMDNYQGLGLHLLDRHDVPAPESLLAVIDKLTHSGQPPLVVVDYIQLFGAAASEDDIRSVMGHVSLALRNLAQTTGAALVCVSAVGRAAYNTIDKRTMRPDKMMVLASAKETGVLEYDAEAVLGIHLYSGSDLGWLCVAKNRSGGPTGDIPVRFDGARGLFEEADEASVIEAHKTFFSAPNGGR